MHFVDELRRVRGGKSEGEVDLVVNEGDAKWGRCASKGGQWCLGSL